MNREKRPVVLISGASSGIGKACAERLARSGYRVYGSSRRASLPPEPVPRDTPVMVRMDVDQDESVRQAVDFIVEAEGRLDVVVNNAGWGIAGSVEDTSIEEARALFETNFFGLLRVCRTALPIMRAQGSGTIVNVSSIGGLVGLPYQALYSASKFAVEGLTEGLRIEVRPYGIRVALIEPGDTATGFTAHRWVAAAGDGSAYADGLERVLRIVEADEQGGVSPEQVARLVERVIARRAPGVRYTVAAPFQRLVPALKRVLPARLSEAWLAKYYQLG